MSDRTVVSTAPPHFALRISGFFLGYFFFGGVNVPFFPVWLQARGLSEVEIASIIAVPALVRVVLTPLAGLYADRAPSRRFAVISFSLPAELIYLLVWPAHDFWLILLTTGTAFTLYALALPPAEALALTGVRRFGLDYGRMRVSGSIAFITANLGSGALLGFFSSNEAIYFFMLAALVSAAAVSFALPLTPPAVRALDDAVKPDTRPSREVLGNVGFLALMGAASLIQASHAMLYSFGSIEWRALGYSPFQVGVFWAMGIVCEVSMFIFSTLLVRRTGPFGLLVAGGIGAMVRWSLFPFNPGFLGFAVLQGFHGLTFGATYVGTQHVIARMVPDRLTASAQGLYVMVSGVMLAVATMTAGPLYERFGIHAFWFMIPIAAAGLVLLASFRRRVRL
jgi:PPP family 3-phenylpropionic acid transporter